MPAFNEAQNIDIVIREVLDVLPDFDLVVVNDGSTDETEQIVRSLGVQVLSLPFNLGVGAAMRLGFKFAKENNFDYAIQIDADGQHLPDEVRVLANHLHKSDVVIGSRFTNGFNDYEVNFVRKFAMKTLGKSLTAIVGTKLTDVSSGFRGSSKKAINLFAEKYPPEYLGDTIESLVIANRSGLTISEIPTKMRPRLHGESSQSTFRALIYTVRAYLVITLSLMQRNK